MIACNLTNGSMPHGNNSIYKEEFPNITNSGEERFIGEIDHGTLIGYKYFEFKNVTRIGIVGRIETEENKARFDGIHALYLVYHGKDKFQMKELKFL